MLTGPEQIHSYKKCAVDMSMKTNVNIGLFYSILDSIHVVFF